MPILWDENKREEEDVKTLWMILFAALMIAVAVSISIPGKDCRGLECHD